jgi:LmbE family N-acetylglucosaminyl deacetylase
MLELNLADFVRATPSILCLGAHSDDIEIGAGGTVLTLLANRKDVDVGWVVFAAKGPRAEEAHRSAERFLAGRANAWVRVESFRERYFPYIGQEIKEYFDDLGKTYSPGLVLTHRKDDAHQDHRTVAELTHNTFRDHLILEYEIPKYDGDLGRPNTYVHLSHAIVDQKIEAILKGFPSQVERSWFTDETFRGLLRLRGVESNAPDGYAEGFHARKLVLGTTSGSSV